MVKQVGSTESTWFYSYQTLDKVGYEPDIWINPEASLDGVYALIEKAIQQ